MARITIGSASDVGMREDNEDSLLAALTQDSSTRAGYSGSAITCAALLVLADGMGGRAYGKIASETATSVIYRELAHVLSLRRRVDTPYLGVISRKAITRANAKINELVAAKPDAGGMGTTVAVALIVRDIISVAHVGDSRAYLLPGDGDALRLLTEDHSVVQSEVRAGILTAEEARRSKHRNVITRAVGVDPTVEADIATVQLPPACVSTLIVSSDGMHGSVGEAQIERILREYGDDPQSAADSLVAEAQANGARDNISVIVARIDTRFHSEAYGSIGLDATNSHIELERYLRSTQRRLPWLTSANLLAFVIGILLTVAIAWQILPGLFPSKSGAPIQAPLPDASSAAAPAIDLTQADYVTPVNVFGHTLAPDVLSWQGNGMVLVGDTATHRLLTIDIDTGDVVKTASDRAGLTQPSVVDGASSAVDAQGDLYVATQSPPVIKKYAGDGHLLRTLGQGMLARPGAVVVAPNGDVLVIDSGVLKRFKAIAP